MDVIVGGGPVGACFAGGIAGDQAQIEGAAAQVEDQHGGVVGALELGQIVQRRGSRLHDGAHHLEVAPVLQGGGLDDLDEPLPLGGAEGGGVGQRHQVGGLPGDAAELGVGLPQHALGHLPDGVVVLPLFAADDDLLAVDLQVLAQGALEVADAAPLRFGRPGGGGPSGQEGVPAVPEEDAGHAHALTGGEQIHGFSAQTAPLNVQVLDIAGIGIEISEVKTDHDGHAATSDCL